MWWMVKDSKGHRSATLTFAVIGMIITSLAMLISMAKSISVGGYDIVFRSIDTTLVLGYLGATVTAYIVRRNKSDQVNSEEAREQLRLGGPSMLRESREFRGHTHSHIELPDEDDRI